MPRFGQSIASQFKRVLNSVFRTERQGTARRSWSKLGFQLAEGGNQPNLNLSKIKEFPLPLRLTLLLPLLKSRK